MWDVYFTQNMRGMNFAGMAGSPSRSGDGRLNSREQFVGVQARKADTEGVRQAVHRIPIYASIFHSGEQAALQFIPCEPHHLIVLVAMPAHYFASLSESYNLQYIFRAGATAHLLTSTLHEEINLNPAANIKGANALRRIELVSCDGQQVYATERTSTGILQTDWAASV